MNINADLIPEVLRQVARMFEKHGYRVRPVGGCIRDMITGKIPKDWDCATDALPDRTFELLDHAGYKPFDISNGHGTVSFIFDGETYEITTLRLDVETDGRHAEVEFVTNFKADAARRDFTLNAMSCDPRTGQVFDYFGGIKDIENKIIRFVGDADERIKEDYLRILRYFRFLGKMSFLDNIDDQTFKACMKNADGLDQISGERIWMEMQQILSSPYQVELMNLMFNSHVADRIGLVYPARYI